MTQEPLDRLHDLAGFLTVQAGLSQRLEELARHAAQATQAASCSICVLAEEDSGKHGLKLFASTASDSAPACDALAGAGVCGSIAPRVLESGQALIQHDFACPRSPHAGAGHTLEHRGRSLIGVPITVDDCMIGVMTLCSRPDMPAFDGNHLKVASIAAALIGKAIQLERVQTLLRSRIAQMTLVRQEAAVSERLTAGMLPPSRLAKLLARSFYKDLAAAGFEPGQIIEAATEIIGQITSDIGRLEKRIARKGTER